MSIFYHTVNKHEVKHYASFVLRSALKLLEITKKTPVAALIDIVICAAVRCSSIEQTCLQHKNAPCGKTVRTHLEKQIESVQDAETRINRGLRKNMPNHLRRKSLKVAIDCLEIGYYGTPDVPQAVRISKPKDGTSRFHTYASAYVVEKGMRYTLAITFVAAGDSMLDVVRRLNKRLLQLGIRVELYLCDRGFYSVEVIRWLIAYDKAFIMPVRVYGKKPKGDKPLKGMRRLKKSKVSHWESYTMESKKTGKVTFDAAVCCDNFQGKRGWYGRRTLVYATHGVEHHSFAWIRETYRSRFGIEASHRQVRAMKIKTTTTDTAMRFFYLGISFILRNISVWLHWNLFFQKQRGPGGRKIKLSRFALDFLTTWLGSAIDEIYGLYEQISIAQPLPAEMLVFC
jgi:putative transposase